MAYERYEVALVLSIINFGTLRWLTPEKAAGGREEEAGQRERRPEPAEALRTGVKHLRRSAASGLLR